MLKAILFDMDGVLIDSEPVHYTADYLYLKNNFGVELAYEDYKGFIGSTIEKIWQYIREKYNLLDHDYRELMDGSEALLKEIVDRDGYEPIEGAKELVLALSSRGVKLAVASSSPMTSIERNISDLGISDKFDAVVSGLTVENPKPAPDIFLKAAAMLGVEPKECLVIEDSENGVRAAKAAGMACLGFINPNSGDQNLSLADSLFESFLNMDYSYIDQVYSHFAGEP